MRTFSLRSTPVGLHLFIKKIGLQSIKTGQKMLRSALKEFTTLTLGWIFDISIPISKWWLCFDFLPLRIQTTDKQKSFIMLILSRAPSAHKTLSKCWVSVGPASATLGPTLTQYLANVSCLMPEICGSLWFIIYKAILSDVCQRLSTQLHLSYIIELR